LTGNGYHDGFRYLYPDKVRFSRFGTTVLDGITHTTASRIDHFLLSKKLLPLIINFTIDFEGIFDSDHRLLQISLNAKPLPPCINYSNHS
jgi:exonuclease III